MSDMYLSLQINNHDGSWNQLPLNLCAPTMQCLQLNIPPTDWNELFKQRGENCLDGEPTLQAQHQLGPEWDDPQPVKQSECTKIIRFIDDLEA